MSAHRALALAVLCTVAGSMTPAAAQRAFRVGATGSLFEPGTAGASSSSGFGGQFAYLAGTDNEVSANVTSWPGSPLGTGENGALALALESTWYPVEAVGVAPFVVSGFGGVRYTRPAVLLGQPTQEWGFSYLMGFGMRANLGSSWSAALEARLRDDDGTRNMEYRAGTSFGFGARRAPQTAPGTIQPFVAAILPLGSAPYEARTPLAGVRFRRDRSRHTSFAVDVGAVGLQPSPDALSGAAAQTTSYYMAPAFEAGLAPAWGRPYLSIGPLLAGFADGPDAGIRAGLHAGTGLDIFAGQRLLVTALSRLTWFQTTSGGNQFGLMLGVAVGPRLRQAHTPLPGDKAD